MFAPEFPREELEHSDTAKRHELDNTIPEALLPNAHRVSQFLAQIERGFGRQVICNSGYRGEALNALVRGAKNSYHCLALAADIKIRNVPAKTLANWIVANMKEWDTIILEFGSWVHVQLPKPGAKPRYQRLTASKVKGKTVYSIGW